MVKSLFGTLADGTEINSYTINNDKIVLTVLDYGATLQSLKFNGVDIVLGYNTLAEYVESDGYLGATVGRYANRIANASFKLGKKRYKLYKNNGRNCLHGGNISFDKVKWQAEGDESSITFKYFSTDKEEGFPGNLVVGVRYYLRQDGVGIEYTAVSDKDTVVNLTNHTYFNFVGGESIENHFIMLESDYYTPIDKYMIPTGELRFVAGTAFDFRCAKSIGRDIDDKEEQLQIAGGYDHNFAIRGEGFRKFAEVSSAKAGIRMSGYTDQPGVQFYSGNFLTGRVGKYGRKIAKRYGFCLETQNYPDAVNHSNFPSSVLKAGQLYHTLTEFHFEKF